MTIAYLCQSLPERAALGQATRREGLLAGLAERGFAVETLELPRSRSRAPEVLRAPSLTAAVRQLRSLDPPLTDLIIEGLPIALALRKHRDQVSGFRVHVDVCDSWLLLAEIRGDHYWSAARALAKRRLASYAIRRVDQFATTMVYISHRDCAMDTRATAGKAARLVVPNGNALLGQALPALDPHGPLVTMGDWRYPPNQEMLSSNIAWLDHLRGLPWPGLRVVGPNLHVIPDSPGIDYLGWVEDIADAYQGVSCALALVRGAGMKNKVLDALALGVPVICSRSALNGLSADLPLVALAEDFSTIEDVQSWAAGAVASGRMASGQTWREAVSPLSSTLNRRAAR